MTSALEPAAKVTSNNAYRASAGVKCQRCGSDAGDDYTFTMSGDAHCRACADAAAHDLASSAAGAGDAFASERRCGCGGVASAGQMINHSRMVVHAVAGSFMGERVEEGSETVFGCASCGKSFAILNRLRRVRLAVRTPQLLLLGFAIGMIPFLILGRGVIGTIAIVVATFGLTWVGAGSLFRDLYLRRVHPPIG
jgi:hypothetical protein